MRRRLFLTVAVATGLLVVAAAALIVFRTAVAEALLTSRLAALGIASPRLAVESLDLQRIVVTEIALGAEAELRADAVTASYRPRALVSGQLDDVSIEGLRLRLDLSGAGPPLGSLHHLLTGGQGAAGPAAMPDVVSLTDGRIEAVTASGDVAAAVSGRWRPAAGTAVLAFSGFGLPHVALETSQLDVAITADRVDATATARGRNDALSLELSATVESWRSEPTLALDLDGDLTPAAWRVSPLPSVDRGTLAVSLHLGGRLQPMEELFTDATAPVWLLGAELGGLLDASLTAVDWRDRAQGVSGKLSLAVNITHGGLEAEGADEGHLRIARIDPVWLDASGAAAMTPQLRDAELTMSFASRDRPLRLRVRPTSGGVDLTVSGGADIALADSTIAIRADGGLRLNSEFTPQRISFSQADIRLRDLALAGGHRLRQLHATGAIDGPPDAIEGTAQLTADLAATRFEALSLGGATLDLAGDLSWSGQRLEIRQRGDGAAALASADFGGVAQIARPFALTLTDGALTLDVAPNGLAVSHAITIGPNPVNVALARAQTAPLTLRADTGPMRLEGAFGADAPYRGKLSLAHGGFGLPDEAISAEQVSATVSLPGAPGERFAEFTVGQLKHIATPAYFAPLRLHGWIDRQDDAFVLTASGSSGGKLEFSARGRHQIADGSGSMRIDLPEATFRKGALQPGQISPLFSELRDATGRIGAVAEIGWGGDGVKGKGRLDLVDISFNAESMAVEGLGASIALDGLFPVSTLRDQRLTVRRIDPALPVEDIAARFRIEPADPPRLRLREAAGRFAGGRLAVSEVLVDPSRPRHAFTIAVHGIDLGTLLGLANVEGVSGSGRLSGTIPVTVVNSSLIVDNGRLAAEGRGVLRVRSEAASAALAGAGEQVALMLRALEDFRYESLSATLNIEAGAAAAAAIHMQGNNPAVLDGYPFAFNIELGGNAADLLVALRQGARISTDLIRPEMR